ncbi:hypothetical protein EZJ58_3587 [Sodalis ligni]|uniref:Uncharacterized protein n=1 Tax=Sodalis ligni TaxID=2697027 RepID=A0A4R1NKU0_9GAMM|nr:hypothetical protein EZJ58_3587 [Sodalis ligni]
MSSNAWQGETSTNQILIFFLSLFTLFLLNSHSI